MPQGLRAFAGKQFRCVLRARRTSCSISGELLADGERWDFVIDGGATASWRNAGGARYWGCMARDCEALVLLPYDGMSGDW